MEQSSNLLVNYKDDEKLMSESLYRNLHVLARFHEPSADFRSVFHPHMFIKSNAKAFFPVLHFIFNCLDPVEFNKRFRWPLLDKMAETNFRKVAVDYMNYLNQMHQLGLETMKLANIHIPGGLKFIKIIHRFTYLAMKLEVNKPEHGPLPDMQSIPDGDDMLEKLEQYVERGMDFVTKLQVQSDKISDRIDEMQTMMESCFDKSESNNEQICWTCLLKEWKDELDRAVRDDVEPQLAVVNLFSQHTVQLNKLLTKLFVEKKENVIEYDKDQLMAAQMVLKKMHPDLESVIDGIVDGNIINFGNLFKVFSVILPNITNKLETFRFGNLEAIEYEYNEIVQYDAIATKYQDLYNEYAEVIQPFIEKDSENFKKFCQNNDNPPFNLLQTPPVTRRAQVNKMRNRLGLIDDLLKKAQLFKEPPMRTTSASRNSTLARPSSCSSLNNYKSQDAALQLLAKPKSSRANLSHSFRNGNTSSLGKFSTPKVSSTMMTKSMTGSWKNPQSEFKFSPSFACMTPAAGVFSENITETTSMMSPNGISVVRKRETSSVLHLNHQPHIVSPTRRFYVTDLPPEFTAMMASGNLDKIDIGTGMGAMDVFNTASHGQQKPIENNDQKDVESNTSNTPSVGFDEFADEFIGNVSDSVLNDILSE